jgi:hypothetical protein
MARREKTLTLSQMWHPVENLHLHWSVDMLRAILLVLRRLGPEHRLISTAK